MDVNLFAFAQAMEFVEWLLEACQDIHQSLDEHLSLVMTASLAALPVFVLVLITTFVGRNRLPAWSRYALWSLVLIRLILPLSFTSPISAQIAWSAIRTTLSDENGLASRWLLSISADPLPDDSSTKSLISPVALSQRQSVMSSIGPGLLESTKVLFFAGTFLVAFALLISFRRMVGWMRNSCACTDGYSLHLIDEGARTFGIGTPIKVLTVHQLKSPATFDWYGPTILLPENFASLSNFEKRAHVWHELARIRRADSVFSILLAVVQILQWWNPVLWWTRRQWLIERELACDQLAMERMDPSEAANFLQTLQSLASQRSKPNRSIRLANATGFVKSHDVLFAIHPRISAATRAPKPETRSRKWVSTCLVAAMSVTALTDAAKLPLKDSPIELPAGATWQNEESPSEVSEEPVTRRYGLDRCISRLRQVDPLLTEEAATAEVRASIERLLQDNMNTRSIASADSIAQRPENANCRIVDRNLVVCTSSVQHDRIARILSGWSDLPRSQICIEVRWTSTPMQLSQLFPATGGEIRASGKLLKTAVADTKTNGPGTLLFAAATGVSYPISVFTRILNGDEIMGFMQKINGDNKASQLFAPKITIFDGNAAAISDIQMRPFVSGFCDKGGSIEPKIFEVEEGLFFDVFAIVDAGKVHLRARIRSTEIVDVKVRKLRQQSDERQIQVPEIREYVMQSTAELDDGETMILVPLQRQENGHLSLFWITPRIIEVEEEEPLLGLPRD